MRRLDEAASKWAFNELVGRTIQQIRTAASMSRRELAEKSGMSVTMLTNIEAGSVPCPLFAARNIAEVVDCTIDDLVPVVIDERESAE